MYRDNDKYSGVHTDKAKYRYEDKYNERYINKKEEAPKRQSLARGLKWFFIIWFSVGLISAIANGASTGNLRHGIIIVIANTLFLLGSIALIFAIIKVRKFVKSFIINWIR